MKKYRLRKDTALYPKGTIAEWCEQIHEYRIFCNNWRGYAPRNTMFSWQIEGNSLWEEITEDQREEKKINPAEEQVKGMEEYIEQKRYSTALEEDQYALRKKQKQFGDIAHQVLGASIYGEYDRVDHQALREESLRSTTHCRYRKLIVNGMNESQEYLDIGFRVPKKYADAWRELLDDNKTP